MQGDATGSGLGAGRPSPIRSHLPTLVGFQGGCGRRCAVSPWRPSPSRCLARIWAVFLKIYINFLKNYKYEYERGINLAAVVIHTSTTQNEL